MRRTKLLIYHYNHVHNYGCALPSIGVRKDVKCLWINSMKIQERRNSVVMVLCFQRLRQNNVFCGSYHINSWPSSICRTRVTSGHHTYESMTCTDYTLLASSSSGGPCCTQEVVTVTCPRWSRSKISLMVFCSVILPRRTVLPFHLVLQLHPRCRRINSGVRKVEFYETLF